MNGFPDGYARIQLAQVTSTLDVAREMAPELSGPTWIQARVQTAARGRRGRAWAGAEQNFAATLVIPMGALETASLHSFVAALAVSEALSAMTGRSNDIRLKWPNDVLFKGRKVSGILLETISLGGAVTHLAIGIGINLATCPPPEDLPAEAMSATSVREACGTVIAPAEMLDQLAKAYARWERQFAAMGFAPIRTAWLKQAARLGEVITARTVENEISGTFRDVDERGQLVLETRDGRVAVPAADVFF